jgi:sugar phosphate isomerase/epimerase
MRGRSKISSMRTPYIKHVANLWSLTDYPSSSDPWSLEQQLDAVKAAGFDGFTTQLEPRHAREAEKRGLFVVGYFASGEKFPELLKSQRDAGAVHINIQLADHDTTPTEALSLTLRLMEEAHRLGGVEPAIEIHRDTCTETPEKAYALADGYFEQTGELLPMTWDFSHLAVVKHLTPENYIGRLLVRPNLIQRAAQFHFRPFNGHHCQVPVTLGDGSLTPEVKDWLPFVGATIRTWLAGNAQTDRTMFAVPEMGPVRGGYNFEHLSNSWEDAVRLRPLLENVWQESLQER